MGKTSLGYLEDKQYRLGTGDPAIVHDTTRPNDRIYPFQNVIRDLVDELINKWGSEFPELNYARIAEEIGISRQALDQLMNGKTKSISNDNFIALITLEDRIKNNEIEFTHRSMEKGELLRLIKEIRRETGNSGGHFGASTIAREIGIPVRTLQKYLKDATKTPNAKINTPISLLKKLESLRTKIDAGELNEELRVPIDPQLINNLRRIIKTKKLSLKRLIQTECSMSETEICRLFYDKRSHNRNMRLSDKINLESVLERLKWRNNYFAKYKKSLSKHHAD